MNESLRWYAREDRNELENIHRVQINAMYVDTCYTVSVLLVVVSSYEPKMSIFNSREL